MVAAADPEPSPFSGSATPSARSMVSKCISCRSTGSSSWELRMLSAVFSSISRGTLMRAGFIWWQFRACFLAWASLVQALVSDGPYLLQNVPATSPHPATPTRVSTTQRFARAPRLPTHQSKPPPPTPPGYFPPKLAGCAAPSVPIPAHLPCSRLSPGFILALKGDLGYRWAPHRRPQPPAAEKMESERERTPKRSCVWTGHF